MHNPGHIHECEKEKSKTPRGAIDALMTIVGVIASLSSVPQIIKIWQTKDISGISLTTYLIALGAVIAWFLYSIYIKNKPLLITSLVSTLIIGTVVYQLLTY